MFSYKNIHTPKERGTPSVVKLKNFIISTEDVQGTNHQITHCHQYNLNVLSRLGKGWNGKPIMVEVLNLFVVCT